MTPATLFIIVILIILKEKSNKPVAQNNEQKKEGRSGPPPTAPNALSNRQKKSLKTISLSIKLHRGLPARSAYPAARPFPSGNETKRGKTEP